MNNLEHTSIRSASQWANFWMMGQDEKVIHAQIAHLWEGQPLSIRVANRRTGKRYQIEVTMRGELRRLLYRFDRWSHDLYFHRGERWQRLPGTLDLDDLAERAFGPPLTPEDWRELVYVPASTKVLDFDNLPDADDVLRKYARAAVRKYVYSRVQPDTDRSAIIWKVVCTLREHGADASEMAAAAMASYCWKSKLEDPRFNAHRWLRNEIERAIKKTRAN